MFRRGIFTQEQYLKLGRAKQACAPPIAYNLLDVGDQPSEDQVRAFEDISFWMRTSNGTFRTTFRDRFREVDEAALRWMQKLFPPGAEIHVEDRAVSHGLTSKEWAERVFQAFPNARFEASDVLLELYEISRGGAAYVLEPSGRAIQYVKSPFVVSLVDQAEPRRYPVNWVVARWAKRRFEALKLGTDWIEAAERQGWRVRKIPFAHPEARELARRNSRFQIRVRSVFDATAEGSDVIRTMNILNSSYFSEQELTTAVNAIFQSMRPGGLWIAGRTLEEDLSNHVSLLRRGDRRWEVVERIGRGWELERLALGAA